MKFIPEDYQVTDQTEDSYASFGPGDYVIEKIDYFHKDEGRPILKLSKFSDEMIVFMRCIIQGENNGPAWSCLCRS